MASDSINHFIETDLADHNIAFQHCPKHERSKSPNSYIMLNAKSGSRTILHTNLGLPELTLVDFHRVKDISKYAWVHFEGRPNIPEIVKMMESIQGQVKISLEMEKLNRNYEPLLPLVNVVFVSKEYAQSQGFSNMTDLVTNFHPELKIVIICPWGDQGAAARDSDGKIIHVTAFVPPHGVVDTIGAGDTFNATVVACLSQDQDLKTALVTGCKVAGAKVGQIGYQGLKSAFYSSI